MKSSYWIPISIEALFDNPMQGVSLGELDSQTVWWSEPWPIWLRKEWFKRGHGLGRTTPSVHLPG